MIPTPVDAINFALSLDDNLDVRLFLEDWLHGEMRSWKNRFNQWKEEQCETLS
jgi:hypothetical protein